MQRPFIRLAIVAAVVASAGLASCRGDAPTETGSILSFASRDSAGGDSIPGDTIPGDTIPPDTIPPDTIPPDTIPPDTIPPDTIPPDTIPPDTIPPDTVPPDTIPPDTVPRDTVVEAFTLRVIVAAADSGADTTSLTRIRDAAVTLYRFAAFPDSGAVPDAVFRRRTGREGTAVFHRLKTAWYRVVVEPPPGSPYGPASGLIAPATSERITVHLLLPRRY